MSPKYAGTSAWMVIQDHIDTHAVETFNNAISYVP